MTYYSYRNLLDYLLDMEDDSDLAGNAQEQYRKLLMEYFFAEESREKAVATLFKNIDFPSELKTVEKLINIDGDLIRKIAENEVLNDTLAGKIILSKQFLKTYYSNHQPEFKKIPPDVQLEILDRIKEKNKCIISAFDKMQEDIEAGKKRKIITLAALIINNVHLRNGLPYNKLDEPADKFLSSLIKNGDTVFTGKPSDMADIGDDTVIKNIVKVFFPIKQHKDLMEFTDLFKAELKRFVRRAKVLSSQ